MPPPVLSHGLPTVPPGPTAGLRFREGAETDLGVRRGRETRAERGVCKVARSPDLATARGVDLAEGMRFRGCPCPRLRTKKEISARSVRDGLRSNPSRTLLI